MQTQCQRLGRYTHTDTYMHTYTDIPSCTHRLMQGKSMRNLINMKIVLFTYSHLYAEMFWLFSLTCNERRRKRKQCVNYIILYSIIFFFYFYSISPACFCTRRGLILNSISARFRGKPGDILRDFNHIAVIFNSFYYYCYCALVALAPSVPSFPSVLW